MDAASFALPGDEVHVWGFALEVPPTALQRCEEVLSDPERARAAAFHFARDRVRFVVARGTLRDVLGRYLGRSPAALEFATGQYGKPRLVNVGLGGVRDLRFNLSHSHTQAMLAVTRGREVGIDLEYMRAEVDCAGIVASHFSPIEQAAWLALPERSRRAAFFHGWVRKEAYVKALGEGLSREPRSYSVELAPEGSGALLADGGAPTGAEGWTVRAVDAPEGFAAAVAHAGTALCVNSRRLEV